MVLLKHKTFSEHNTGDSKTIRSYVGNTYLGAAWPYYSTMYVNLAITAALESRSERSTGCFNNTIRLAYLQ